MARKQLYLSDKQQRKVRRIAEARGCSEAEVVRQAVDRLPEYDDAVTQRLADVGFLVQWPDDDDDQMTEAEAEQLEREMDEWGRKHGPLGLSEAVLEDRR
jgi:hypothetical protein